MSTIQCFMLHDTGERGKLTGNVDGSEYTCHVPIYADDQGNRYTLRFLDTTLDSGEVLKTAPPGAMWNADWYKDSGIKPGPDGLWLIVKTPAGDWFVDGPSSNGPGWTREGAVPNVTARPSILMTSSGNYHGFLTNGQLVEC